MRGEGDRERDEGDSRTEEVRGELGTDGHNRT